MHNRYQPQQSKLFAAMIIFIHVGPIILLLPLDIPSWSKVFLGGWCATSLLICYYRYIRFNIAKSIISFWQNEDQSWQLCNSKKQIFQAILQGSSTISNFVIILNFNLIENNQADPTNPKISKLLQKILNCQLRRTLIIFRDALTPDEFRKLKVAISVSAAD